MVLYNKSLGGEEKMFIKRIPICPFCYKEMERKTDMVRLPGRIKRPNISQSTRSPSFLDGYVIEDFSVHNVWACLGCGFVALWDGEPK